MINSTADSLGMNCMSAHDSCAEQVKRPERNLKPGEPRLRLPVLPAPTAAAAAATARLSGLGLVDR